MPPKRNSEPMELSSKGTDSTVFATSAVDENNQDAVENGARPISLAPNAKPVVGPKPKLLQFPDATFGYVSAPYGSSGQPSHSPSFYRCCSGS